MYSQRNTPAPESRFTYSFFLFDDASPYFDMDYLTFGIVLIGESYSKDSSMTDLAFSDID